MPNLERQKLCLLIWCLSWALCECLDALGFKEPLKTITSCPIMIHLSYQTDWLMFIGAGFWVWLQLTSVHQRGLWDMVGSSLAQCWETANKPWCFSRAFGCFLSLLLMANKKGRKRRKCVWTRKRPLLDLLLLQWVSHFAKLIRGDYMGGALGRMGKTKKEMKLLDIWPRPQIHTRTIICSDSQVLPPVWF